MNALRVAGALLLVGCGWFAGGAFQGRLDGHAEVVRQVTRLLERVRQEIAYRRTDPDRLYAQLGREGLLCPRPGGMLQTLAPPSELTAEESECFSECFSGLGRASAEQECERLDYYIERFCDFRQQAEGRAQEQAGLSRRLGLAAGAMLGLLFL
ncbi:MAG: hypothetical protein ACI4LE_06435 [Faecalibacterium sp.]